jgi:RluA family pseudouridine synthase
VAPGAQLGQGQDLLTPSIVHLDARHAGPLADAGPLRGHLRAFTKGLHVRGTILLSPHGLRLSITGTPEAAASLLEELRRHPELAALETTVRPLAHQPFTRLVLRVIRTAGDWAHESESAALELPAAGPTLCPDCQASLLRPATPNPTPAGTGLQKSPCPRCGESADTAMADTIKRRHARILAAVTPLPGRVPFDNFKPVRVPVECDGWTLIDTLGHLVEHLPEAVWETECARGLLLNERHEVLSARHIVRAGDHYWHKFPGVLEPDVDGDVRILHEDEALVVLHKPAPLPMHAGGRYFRNTLQHILRAAYDPHPPFPAHRLDANTTGLVLAARNRRFAGLLQPQFANGQVRKRYLVRVHGAPARDQFDCDAPISTSSGELGSRCVDPGDGRAARTEFHVLERSTDGTSLLEARPLTGRTHQIRLHLWHLGYPVCGDTVYLPGNLRGQTQTPTLLPGDPPLCLHAWNVTFFHPATREPVEFTAPPPDWAKLPSSTVTISPK